MNHDRHVRAVGGTQNRRRNQPKLAIGQQNLRRADDDWGGHFFGSLNRGLKHVCIDRVEKANRVVFTLRLYQNVIQIYEHKILLIG